MDLKQGEFLARRQSPPPTCPESANVYLCVLCVSLLNDPVQSTCGDRMCRSCVEFLDQSLRQRGISSMRCPGCGEQLTPSQCFPDRAASRDLSVLIVRCPNNCLWEGRYQEYSTHYKVCPRQPQRCPHPSCMMTLPPDEMEQHVVNCRYKPVQCRYCHQEFLSEEVESHERQCTTQPCPNCGQRVSSSLLQEHLTEECPKVFRKCTFAQFGCTFSGLGHKVTEHERDQVALHMRLMSKVVTSISQQVTQAAVLHQERPPQHVDRHIQTAIDHMEGRITELTRQVGDLLSEVQRMKTESHARAVATEDAISKQQRSIKELQDYYGDIALNIQTIQASSHGPIYIWKIPDLSRRRREAVLGMTVSLYSAPFYTSRHGYQYYHSYFWHGSAHYVYCHPGVDCWHGPAHYVYCHPGVDCWPGPVRCVYCNPGVDCWPGPVRCVYCHPGVDCWHGPARCVYCHPGVDCWHGSACCVYYHPEFLFSPTLTEMNVASGCPMCCPLSVPQNCCCVQNDRPCQHCHFGNTEVQMAIACEDCPTGDNEEFVPH